MERINRGDSLRSYSVDVFGGLDTRIQAREGSINFGHNLTSEFYPELASREKRYMGAPSSVGGYDAFDIRSGKVMYVLNNEFWYDGRKIGALKEELRGSKRWFVCDADEVYIFPDGMKYKDWRYGLSEEEISAIEGITVYDIESSTHGGENDNPNYNGYDYRPPVLKCTMPETFDISKLTGISFSYDYYTFKPSSRYHKPDHDWSEAGYVGSGIAYSDGAELDGDYIKFVTHGYGLYNTDPDDIYDGEVAIKPESIKVCDALTDLRAKAPLKKYDDIPIFLREAKFYVSDEGYNCIEARNYHCAEDWFISGYMLFMRGDIVDITIERAEYPKKRRYRIDQIYTTVKHDDEIKARYIVTPIDGNEFPIISVTDSVDSVNEIRIERVFPEMPFGCYCNGRFFGVDNTKIVVSALGKLNEFNKFDGLSTDSWQVESPDGGESTGVYSYLNSVLFFKEDRVIKLLGDVPSEFSLYTSECLGVKPGCEASLNDVGGVLLYLSRMGVCAYTGSMPSVISESIPELAEPAVKAICSGSDGRRYFLEAELRGERKLYVYDSWRRIWHSEDGGFIGFACSEDGMYGALSEGVIVKLSGEIDEGMSLEKDVLSVCEFADGFFGSPDMKKIGKFRFRCIGEEGSEVKVLISYDGDPFEEIGAVYPKTVKRTHLLTVRPRPFDTYRLRFEGKGAFRIQMLTTEFCVSSEANGGFSAK